MKKTRISFIIPTLNEAEHISSTLDQLQGLRLRGHEVILSDGGSNDNTLSLSKGKIDHHVINAPGRASQMNDGAKIASGDIFCFLHADTETPENIDKLILQGLSNSNSNSNSNHWGFFNIKLSGRNWQFRIIEYLINIRSCLTRVATGDQAIFITKHSFNNLNGFSNIPLMEDIEISKRLKKTNKPVCIKNASIITSSRRWEKHGIVSTVLLMWQLRLRYFLGTSPDQLAKTYKPHKPINVKKKQQLIIFIKAPVPGLCKTRLTPYLSPEVATEFYKSLVKNCFNKIKNINNTDISIFTYPDINNPFIKTLSLEYATTCHVQTGEDLGERMFNALDKSLKTYEKSVLIGTDCPILDKSYLDKAFNALDQHDMVLGPANDGGYVLIGASKTEAQLFNNINWGTDSVLKQSLRNAHKSAYKTHLLDTLWDIDTPEDYIKYQNLIQQQTTNTAQET